MTDNARQTETGFREAFEARTGPTEATIVDEALASIDSQLRSSLVLDRVVIGSRQAEALLELGILGGFSAGGSARADEGRGGRSILLLEQDFGLVDDDEGDEEDAHDIEEDSTHGTR